MPHVYSTLAADTIYASYVETGMDIRVPDRKVFINGGTGVASKHLVTPRGVVTEVTNEEVTFLRKNPVFQQHEKGGYIVIEDQEVKIEKVVANMVEKDVSAPLTPADYENGEEGAKPLVLNQDGTRRRR